MPSCRGHRTEPGRLFSWWQRFGVSKPFDAEDSTNLDLYLLTKDIGATLARL